MDKESELLMRSRFLERDGELARSLKLFVQLEQAIKQTNKENSASSSSSAADAPSYSSSPADSPSSLYSSLVRCLSYYGFSMARLADTRNTQQQELKQYQSQQTDLQYSMDDIRRDIERLKGDLLEATRQRAEAEEDERILEEIHKFPSRAETAKQIAAIEGEITALKGEQEYYIQAVQRRSQEFDEFALAAQAIKEKFAKEDEERAEKFAMK